MSVCLPLVLSANELDERIGLDIAAHLHEAGVLSAVPLLRRDLPRVRLGTQHYLDAIGYRRR